MFGPDEELGLELQEATDGNLCGSHDVEEDHGHAFEHCCDWCVFVFGGGCSVRFSSVPKASQVLQAWGQVCDIVCMAACAK